MRVGILTFHDALNYGAVLQCYALQNTLMNLGYEVEVIDYKNDFINKFYSPFYIEKFNLKKIAYMFYAFNSKVKRNKIFKNFRTQYLKLSKTKYNKDNIEDADKIYDVIIVGSDQVWNLEQTDGDLNYLLKFAKTTICCSYAASFGISCIADELKDSYIENLSKFRDISVREKSGKQIVKELANKEARVNVDPTLLLPKEEWKRITNEDASSGKYICVYKINLSQGYKYAKQLSKETGLKVIVLKPDRSCPNEFEKIKYASPTDFLKTIANAEYVITDSFHGCVFSIIFEKQFIACLDSRANNKNTRITELLDSTGLQNRLINDKLKVLEIQKEINYLSVEEKLMVEREKSIKYLEAIRN